MPELSTLEVLLRLTVAAVLGGAIGMEREIREREAGLRTHLLVSVGAALFTLVSAYAWADWSFSTPRGIVFDPTRIAAQIVTGIGFLGAGAIIRQGLTVRGLTTAATLWLVAAIGMASGAGYWEAAVIATVGALVTLWPLRLVAHGVLQRIRPEDEQRLVVDLAGQQGAAPVLASLEGLGGRVSQFQLSESRDGRELVLTVEFPERMEASSVAGRLAELEHVRGVRWADLRASAARLAEREQAARAAGRAAGLGARAARRRRLPARDGLDVLRERAGEGAPRPRARAARGPGCSARTRGSRRRRSTGVLASSPRAGRRTASRRLLAALEVTRRIAAHATSASSSAWTSDGERGARTGQRRGHDRDRAAGQRGFGYDPIFVPLGETRTVAELGNAWKAENSHRARAARALRSRLVAADT